MNVLYELEKEASNFKRGLNTLGGVALAGSVVLPMYGLYQHHKTHKNLQEAFKNAERVPVEQLNVPENIHFIDTHEKFNKWFESNKSSNPLENMMVNKTVSDIYKSNDNNGFFHGGGGLHNSSPALIVKGDKDNMYIKDIIHHELGHYQDYQNLGATSQNDFFNKWSKRNPYNLIENSISPKKNPLYLSEEIAWDLANIPHTSDLRQKALATYENIGKLKNKMNVAATLASLGFGLMLV